jgi:HSP20 family protein
VLIIVIQHNQNKGTEKIRADPNPPSLAQKHKMLLSKGGIIMLVPSIFGENLFDDWFDVDFPQWPEFRDLDRAERKLYGRHADRLMKTDVHEHDDHYEVDIDLPGFKKEEIKLELNNGYLTVGASKEHDQTNNGKVIRKERYSGSMSRSFYVGEGIKEEDVHAKFEHGVLHLELPKEKTPEVPEKKLIQIEG